MSFQIQRGLFQFDFMDQCAILGVSVEANHDEIRKQYHKIARRLHPDQLLGKSTEEKQKASQILSKLVNPAYKQLSSEKELVEYRLILSTVAKRVVKDWEEKKIQSENAKKLLLDRSNIMMAYNSAIKALGDQLYQNLDLGLESIAEISEINMVYLLRSGGGNITKSTSTATPPQPVIVQPQPVNTPTPANRQTPPTSTSNQQPASQPAKPSEPKIDVVEPYCRRAEEYINKQNYTNALIELRDAVKLDPGSSRVHALLGMVYLYQNQATIAKIHINRAIEINPKDETALKAKQLLDKPSGKQSSSGKTSGKKDDKSDEGMTLFGIKIGGKKK